ncbi:MAG: hypothetical protein H6R10_3083 [Rhodocyclaceae bacterium]|nr:hypothetical protein [Rhodocyclaceae bacterium]
MKAAIAAVSAGMLLSTAASARDNWVLLPDKGGRETLVATNSVLRYPTGVVFDLIHWTSVPGGMSAQLLERVFASCRQDAYWALSWSPEAHNRDRQPLRNKLNLPSTPIEQPQFDSPQFNRMKAAWCSQGAMAATDTELAVATARDVAMMLNLSTIRDNGKYREFWVAMKPYREEPWTHPTADGGRLPIVDRNGTPVMQKLLAGNRPSARIRYSVDCGEEKILEIMAVAYAPDGSVKSSSEPADKANPDLYKAPAPGTIGVKLATTVCSI